MSAEDHAKGFPFDPVSFLTACSSNVVSPRRLVASGFNQLQVTLALAIRSREVSRNNGTGLASIDRRIRGELNSQVARTAAHSPRGDLPNSLIGESSTIVRPNPKDRTKLQSYWPNPALYRQCT